MRSPLLGQREDGFTLVELLVVMIVVGVLAALAVPAFLTQRKKAHEATVKSDVEYIAKHVTGYYVDGHAALILTAGSEPSTWVLSDPGSVVGEGSLSPGNQLSLKGFISSEDAYCVAINPAFVGAATWRATPAGLAPGDCP